MIIILWALGVKVRLFQMKRLPNTVKSKVHLETAFLSRSCNKQFNSSMAFEDFENCTGQGKGMKVDGSVITGQTSFFNITISCGI